MSVRFSFQGPRQVRNFSVSAALGSRIIFSLATSSTTFFLPILFFLSRCFPRCRGWPREENRCEESRSECVHRARPGEPWEGGSSSHRDGYPAPKHRRFRPRSEDILVYNRGLRQALLRSFFLRVLRRCSSSVNPEHQGRQALHIVKERGAEDRFSEIFSSVSPTRRTLENRGFPQPFLTHRRSGCPAASPSSAAREAVFSQTGPFVKTKTSGVMRIYATSWKGHGNFACTSQVIERIKQTGGAKETFRTGIPA